jgi:hypothetical protein
MRAFIGRFAYGDFDKMDTHQHFRTVWMHRSASSLFGAASHPVVRNGELLCFDTEDRAQAECDRLNAGSGGSHVHYTVKPAYVQPFQADGLASPEDVLALLSEAFRRASQRGIGEAALSGAKS